MIRHIVFFSMKDAATASEAISQLQRLGSIPGSSHFEVRENARVDQFDNDIDIVVYGEFPDLASLHAYKAHPTYTDVTTIVRPMREIRFAADVES